MELRERVRLCRSWLALPGADAVALRAASGSGADVLIQELEDFVPEPQRPAARAMTAEVLGGWGGSGAVLGVRINPLASGGRDDLAAAMPARPDVVMFAKCESPDQARELDEVLTTWERDLGWAEGATLLVPTIESAFALRTTFDIVTASPRVVAALVASEDMAADLGAVRGPAGTELHHVRARFHVDCVAARVLSIDCPYTWTDVEGLREETRHARGLGYRAKCAVASAQATVIKDVLTPSPDEVSDARDLVDAFDRARAQGRPHPEHRGRLVELPIYLNARRTLDRAEALNAR